MAFAKLRKRHPDGARTYQLIQKGRAGQPDRSRNWRSPAGWSEKSIQRELRKQISAFEADCAAGVVQTRKEKAARVLPVETVREYGELVFLPEKAASCAESTRLYYKHILGRLYEHIGDMKISEVSQETVRALLAKEHDDGISDSYYAGEWQTLRQIFRDAHASGLIPENPIAYMKRPRYNKADSLGKRRKVQAFTVEQLRAISGYLETQPLIWQAYVRLSIDTGARRAEILGLKWPDVDPSAGTITIQRNLCYSHERGIYEDTPKTPHSFRTLDVDPEVMKLLMKLQRSQKVVALGGYVFTQEDGSAMFPTSPNSFMRRMGEALGISPCTPHMLRHTFATIAITHGADIVSVSQKLGHAKVSVTLDMYAHASGDSIKAAGDVFRQAVSGE